MEKKMRMQCLPVVRFNLTIFWKETKDNQIILHGMKVYVVREIKEQENYKYICLKTKYAFSLNWMFRCRPENRLMFVVHHRRRRHGQRHRYRKSHFSNAFGTQNGGCHSQNPKESGKKNRSLGLLAMERMVGNCGYFFVVVANACHKNWLGKPLGMHSN